ncbi:tRNA (adenosine(37)-N6)-threonylcarbamoyltransferase complex dimerization subunit type 1 TsaB [Crenobacter cavernae]|uniref:tRNA (Adenosine(37)-N6)-threonylcarbamoyltransferase complex dimerization subunit type 1 TsaB n=1 Tax=Crenobacter cavernae TaxID=2290923 RepID=A0A345YAB0_9NEIS|nr:tRNA (adenosine(37)-N6)-threonylcarbamoyltransferase complex dimerization subunit type 1 TsaB [Crenobacter cavernae]AXK40862.1 tRNA (adenosine(37)-N6)-threonylcarbamoyltransferase complex dimerization subunit type 1 TsaB [Crenobacter cavernae]
MKLLALDTSTDHLSVGLMLDDATLVFHEPVGQQHAERTLPEIGRLLAEAGVTLGQLDAIVYGQGPGSFTGLRIACGIAQGLAFSAKLPLIGIPTLDAVAAQDGSDKRLVCLDARMQQVFSARYENGLRVSDITVGAPELVELDGDGWTGLGSGFAAYPDELSTRLGLQQVRADLKPHAAAYLALAATGRYPQHAADQAELLYIRNKIALTAREQQARRG